jgi:hypothetical protein
MKAVRRSLPNTAIVFSTQLFIRLIGQGYRLERVSIRDWTVVLCDLDGFLCVQDVENFGCCVSHGISFCC